MFESKESHEGVVDKIEKLRVENPLLLEEIRNEILRMFRDQFDEDVVRNTGIFHALKGSTPDSDTQRWDLPLGIIERCLAHKFKSIEQDNQL